MEKDRLFNRGTLLLIPVGIAINIGLAQLVLLLKLPLILDSIGTILVAALGGYLPGIMVGFFPTCSTAFRTRSPSITESSAS